MNIHTQQSDCEAEIAAGAWGLGPRRPATAPWYAHYYLDEVTAAAAKQHNCRQNWTGPDRPRQQDSEGNILSKTKIMIINLKKRKVI